MTSAVQQPPEPRGPQGSPADLYPFERFAAIRRMQGNLVFSKDGRHLYYSVNTSGQFNLWRQRIDGGCPQQLTALEDQTVRWLARAPGDDRLAFIADRDGDEFWQIHLLDPSQPWPVQLTPGGPVRNELSSGAFSPDGRYLAYGANQDVPTDVDVYVRDLETGEVRRVFAGRRYFVPVSWSPGGRYLLLADFRGNTDVDLYLLEVASGKAELLTPLEEPIVYWPRPWSPDGQGFYVITDEGREFKGLAYFSLAERALRWIETPDWDVEDVVLSRDGRILAWVVNEDGVSRLRARELAVGRDGGGPSGGSGRDLPLPELPMGVVRRLAVSDDGSHLAFTISTPRRPADVYVVDLRSRELRRLTDNVLGGIADEEKVEPELIRFPTFDGRLIPAWLYRPKQAGAGQRCPVVLSIHGGPEAQELPDYLYSGLYQYWLRRGIGVLAPNIRGSTGYGKSYQKLIHRDWGGNELRDIEAAARYLRHLEWVDPGRLGVFGGSFGGFATLSAVSRLPEYWAAGVDIVGPSNLITFARAVPPTWRRFMKELVGDPDEDAEMLRERSPLTYADQIRAPLMVIQGAKDPRVNRAESEQLVERLRAKGREVEYLLFEDEGHGFTRRKNEMKALGAAARFMEEKLLGGTGTEAGTEPQAGTGVGAGTGTGPA